MPDRQNFSRHTKYVLPVLFLLGGEHYTIFSSSGGWTACGVWHSACVLLSSLLLGGRWRPEGGDRDSTRGNHVKPQF